METPYRLVLIDTEGRTLGQAMSPVLPRYLHLHPDQQTIEMTDEPTPEDTVDHVDSFARIASAVWVDDERDALYVRVDVI
jgi:hypothetical protein